VARDQKDTVMSDSETAWGVWRQPERGTGDWIRIRDENSSVGVSRPWSGTEAEAMREAANWTAAFTDRDARVELPPYGNFRGTYTAKPLKGELMKDRMLQFFAYDHLPEHLQAVSKPFAELATHMVATLPSNPERTVALRKLLEAKDCAVRALIYKES
jgi:hypothetical protein